MEKDVYVVTGATGNIGRALSEALLAAGKRVRAVGRSEERLKALTDKGAEPAAGSLEDAAFLTRVFRGAKAVFTMIPPNYATEDYRAYQNLVGDAEAKAIEEAGVTHVVNLSSVGAHLPEGTGPIKGLYDQEQRLNALEGVNVVHLRPAYFMENWLFSVNLIRKTGTGGGALDPNLAMPMIATKDIAAAAAARLLSEPTSTGKQVRELLGPKDYTVLEANALLGKAIGREDLRYVQFAYEDVRQALIAEGMSAGAADELIELDRGLNEGLVAPTETRSAENTTPTTLEEFAQTFAAAYRASAGKAGEAASV